MTTLIKGETQALLFLFCAGIAVMLLFSVRNVILDRCSHHRRVCSFVYLIFWIMAAFLFYEFAYFSAYGCITWYSLAAFGCGIVLWKKRFCGIITLYHTAQKQDRDKEDEKKIKRASSKIRR